jgi:hypothetical protein
MRVRGSVSSISDTSESITEISSGGAGLRVRRAVLGGAAAAACGNAAVASEWGVRGWADGAASAGGADIVP